MSSSRRTWIPVLLVLAAAAVPATAQARPASSAKDGRPNILVVMTDDQSASDLAKMPNVRRLLAAKGTTFENAVDSFPLCCPARATFITGQYAHNHGVLANFYPFGWYGMKNRRNTLPAWLQRSGYRTGLVGKWLNGYGARDAHGEVPHGFDIWRGLLDASAYDYFNFVMNRDGKLKTWGDSDFARKLVKFSKVEVIDVPTGLPGLLAALRKQFGPPPYRYWGTAKPKDYSPDVTGAKTARLVKAERRSKKPFFIWWAPAASHREDVATTLMGRPGPDPRPAPRYAKRVSRLKLPRGANFNEADLSDKPANMRNGAPQLDQKEIAQLESNYQGRIGSLLAVDDHVKKLVEHPEADRSAEEHHDRVPVRQRLDAGRAPHPRRQVPALRGVAADPADRARTRRSRGSQGGAPGLEHRLRPDVAGHGRRTRRPHDRRRVAVADPARWPQAARPGTADRGAATACSRTRCRSIDGPGPTRAFAPTGTPTWSTPRRATPSCTTGAPTRPSCATSPGGPSTRASRPGSPGT